MAPELSKTSLQLEALRGVYKRGDHAQTVVLAQQTILENPQSIVAHIIKGNSELALGRATQAYQSHLQADQLYEARKQPQDPLSPDYLALQKSLVTTAIVLGRYQEARGRGIALRRKGDSAYAESARLSAQELKTAVRRAQSHQDYAKAVNLAECYFVKSGAEEPEVALSFANNLLMNPENISLKDLVFAHTIALRLAKTHKNMPQVWNVLGFTHEIALAHPQREVIKKEAVSSKGLKGLVASKPAILMFYRQALAVDPDNAVALERYKAIKGVKYEPQPWIKNLRQEGYEPESYLPVSPRLKNNPEDQLFEQEEIAWYWEQHDPRYKELIASLNRQIDSPMDPRCRIAICIPAYKEGKNIYRTLQEYTKQKGVKAEEIEIIILENHVARPGIERDNTREEVNRFKKDHPQMKVRRVFYAFPQKAKAMGNIRKTVFDLALYRNMQRRKAEPGKDFILASNDADFYGMKEWSLHYIIDTFDKNKRMDIMSGKCDFPKEAYVRFPVLHAVVQFANFHNLVRDRYIGNGHRLGSSGACSYFRSGVYAAIGGSDFKVFRGSDSEIGRRIAYYRGASNGRRLVSINALRIFTDPRRALSKMVMGGNFVNQWDDVQWQEDTRVAGKSWRDFNDDTLTRFNKKRFQEELNAYFAKRASSIMKNPSSEIAKLEFAMIDRTFKLLGVDKYHSQHGKIVLDDTQRLESYLREYQQKNRPGV